MQRPGNDRRGGGGGGSGRARLRKCPCCNYRTCGVCGWCHMHFSSVQQEAVRTAVQLPGSMPGPQQPGQGVWPPSLELVHNATLLFGMQSACWSSPWLWLSLCPSPWSPLGTRMTFFQSWNGGFCFYDTFHAHITMETRVCARMCLRAGREQPYLPRHCGVSPPPAAS